MGEMLINNWGGGIGDDPFLSRPGECLDMDGLDIRTTPRRIKADGSYDSFTGVYTVATAPYNDTLNCVSETIDGAVQSYGAHCYIDATNIDLLCAGADKHITVGSNLSDYSASTNPEGVRHFFFTYNNGTNPIKIVAYVAGVRANRTAVNTSAGASPADKVNARTSAVCYIWKGAVLFARNNLIYEFNPTTELVSSGTKIELPIGSIVKYMYYYNGQIQIVYTIENDTYIQGCSYDGTNYVLSTYIDKSTGYKCLDAVGNGGKIYWISTSGVHIWSGQSQLVKLFTLTSSAVVGYNKDILRIGDGVNFYEYGVTKPGYGSPFTKRVITDSIKGVTQKYLFTYATNQFYRKEKNALGYKAVTYYTSHPYTAGQFGIDKKGLGIRIGYRLPRDSYTNPATQCSIVVGIQTNDIEAVNSTTFVTIATITDITQTSREIMFTEIAKSLGDAGYSEEFGYFRLKITLNSGDQYSGSNLFRKSPEVYDYYITHEEIKQSF